MLRLRIVAVCLLMVVSLLPAAIGVFAAEAREECRLCGMWIDRYMHTRHVLTTADGTRISFCSFTCAAKYMRMPGVKVKRLQVADYLTTDLVDAETAFYLVESDAPPVMSYISIIAFGSMEKAEGFQKVHGGQIS